MRVNFLRGSLMPFIFDKEFSAANFTSVENAFITEYLPRADGDAVKVYLYGLFLCANPQRSCDLDAFSSALSISPEKVMDCLVFLEEFGLIAILGKDPLSVKYLPVHSTTYNKPRKYKAEKYTDFVKGVQTLLPSRMISTGEYTEYFNVMESFGIKPEAMLMIIKYCTDRKGSDVGYRYIIKVAKDFGNRGITTVEKVENELSSYILRTAEIEKILSALSLKRSPDIDDLKLYKKWTQEMSFDTENIVFAAKTLKKSTMSKLDDFMTRLYSMKCFSREEIADYVDKKQAVYDLTIKINRALSVYVEVLDTEIENYVSHWVSYGFSDEALQFIATRCFMLGKKSLVDMDEMITELRQNGFIDLHAVNDYFEIQKKNDEFIAQYLSACGLSRRPTPWDRENLKIWRAWNFSDEMIKHAASLSSGKSSPLAYMNGILSNWKNKNVFSPEQLNESQDGAQSGQKSQEVYNREYERRRSLALSRSQKNIDTAMLIDGFLPVYERIFSIEKDLAFAEFASNDEALKKLETEKKDILAKAQLLLKKKGLTLADLSPRYACEKCNDTGYVGTHRCDCFEKFKDLV